MVQTIFHLLSCKCLLFLLSCTANVYLSLVSPHVRKSSSVVRASYIGIITFLWQVKKHLEGTGLFSDHQYGFRTFWSTAHLLTVLMYASINIWMLVHKLGLLTLIGIFHPPLYAFCIGKVTSFIWSPRISLTPPPPPHPPLGAYVLNGWPRIPNSFDRVFRGIVTQTEIISCWRLSLILFFTIELWRFLFVASTTWSQYRYTTRFSVSAHCAWCLSTICQLKPFQE